MAALLNGGIASFVFQEDSRKGKPFRSSSGQARFPYLKGDEALLRPYEGEMEFDQLPDTLEHLYPQENRKY